MPHIELGDTIVPVSTVAKNIGVFFNDALSMNNQAQHICRVAYFHLHCIGKIRNLLDRKTTEIMIHTYLTMETAWFLTTLLPYSKEYKTLLLAHNQNKETQQHQALRF